MKRIDLTVAISALGRDMGRLSTTVLRRHDCVTYLILVQGGTPADRSYAQTHLVRDDIRVCFLDTLGVAKSRNAALAQVETEVLLFADADLEFLTEAYGAIIGLFQKNGDMDFACCRLLDENNRPFKRYPAKGTAVSRLNCGRTGTPEMALRVVPFRERGISFDEAFGAGAVLASGDEYIFLCDSLKQGLKGQHEDVAVALHRGQSTGHIGTAQSFVTREKVLRRALAPWSWPYRVAFAAKHFAKFPDWKSRLRFMRP